MLPKHLDDKVSRLVMERLNSRPKPMGLDEFADFWMWQDSDTTEFTLRHNKESCDYWQTKIDDHPDNGANLKMLMVLATVHWQEAHQ